MSIKIRIPNREIDSLTLQTFETSFGTRLPDDYRAFLLVYNGGKPEKNLFKVPSAKTNSGVNRFYGLVDESQPGDLRYENKLMTGRVPPGVLIIGLAEGGNCICLSLRPEKFGEVLFWDHEYEAEEGCIPTFSNLFLVATSFHDFVENTEHRDSIHSKSKEGKVKKGWIDPEFLSSLKKKKEQ